LLKGCAAKPKLLLPAFGAKEWEADSEQKLKMGTEIKAPNLF
jgi:hypothetical protein